MGVPKRLFWYKHPPPQFYAADEGLRKNLEEKGFLVFIYLDDIFLLAPTKRQVLSHLDAMVDTLLQAGFKINVKRSLLNPTQELKHLGIGII